MPSFQSTKTYTHANGLSCCFRQWKANSHCNKLHGYAIQVSLVFTAFGLDNRNWVMDFGACKPIKSWIEEMFDHKTLVAADDPELDTFRKLHQAGIVDLVIVPAVGCEKFAEMIGKFVHGYLMDHHPKVMLVSCEVREHEANSAIYLP